MLLLEFFQWWYGRGWATALQDTRKNLSHISDAFSVSILLRTLFAPWRRIITYPGAGLDAHIRAALDNAVSRLVGFMVRMSVLVSAGFMLIVFLVLGLVELVVWPTLPVVAIGLIVWGLI